VIAVGKHMCASSCVRRIIGIAILIIAFVFMSANIQIIKLRGFSLPNSDPRNVTETMDYQIDYLILFFFFSINYVFFLTDVN